MKFVPAPHAAMARATFILRCSLAFSGLFAEGPAAVRAQLEPTLIPETIRQPAWGRISFDTNQTGTILVEVQTWPPDKRLTFPTPFPNITSAHLIDHRTRRGLNWVFNDDATTLHVEMPDTSPARLPAALALETAGPSGQFSGGRVVFSALDAQVQGKTAKLESHPGNHRIGFWTDPADQISWSWKPTRWGKYDLELAFSADGGEGTEIELEIAGQRFAFSRPTTGSWYRYQTLPIGRFYLPTSTPCSVALRCKSLRGPAVMNLKALTLRPAPEGQAIFQQASGVIELLARDAITHSVMMRYEPQTNKNCLGYWTNPKDWAQWDFQVIKPGDFEVEVFQGCGKGQGGSEVAVDVADQRLTFVVEDTGHFQNFLQRRIGRVTLNQGNASLEIRPLRKQAAAVVDIREIRLVPRAR
jgi:hypothetical protein